MFFVASTNKMHVRRVSHLYVLVIQNYYYMLVRVAVTARMFIEANY